MSKISHKHFERSHNIDHNIDNEWTPSVEKIRTKSQRKAEQFESERHSARRTEKKNKNYHRRNNPVLDF